MHVLFRENEDRLLDPASARALAARLLDGEAIFFPVRHHSPACAWHLRRLLERRPPREILVEGPQGFSELIPLLVSPEARAPFAIYSHCVLPPRPDRASTEPRRFAAYYPFCDYSPELVALRHAAAEGIPARFIDLDYPAQVILEDKEPTTLDSLLGERRLRGSRGLAALAEHCRCRDQDDLWDHLLETGFEGLETHELVARVAAYCLIAREESPPESLEADGTLAREREMAAQVRHALAARREAGDARPVLVVTGGFHSLVLPALVNGADLPSPEIPDKAVLDHRSTLIRYGFESLSRLHGYAAGMPAPAWYQLQWELAGVAPGDDRGTAVLGLLQEIATRCRELGELDGVTTPALMAAHEQAWRLAELRAHPAPTREDLLDAVRGSMVQGEPGGSAALAMAHARLIGNRVGAVPKSAGLPPLVADFERRAQAAHLRLSDSDRRRLKLDLYRKPEHRLTSRLLHGLTFLDVAFALRTAGPDFVRGAGLNRLHEHWEYQLSPATDARLVEAARYGTSVPEAVAARFAERLAQAESDVGGRTAAAMVQQLTQALVLGLHAQVPRLLDALRRIIAADPDLVSVAAGTRGLLLLWESREPLESQDAEGIESLLAAAYARACYLIGTVASPAEPERRVTIAALKQIREVPAGARETLDPDLFWHAIESLLRESACAPIMAGACQGLLYSGGRLPAEVLARLAPGRLQGSASPRDGVDYLAGLMETAREAIWQLPELLAALDTCLGDWEPERFLALLPELRLAFSTLTPRETDRVAQSVAQLTGVASLGPRIDYSTDEHALAEHLHASAALRESLKASGLGDWLEAGHG